MLISEPHFLTMLEVVGTGLFEPSFRGLQQVVLKDPFIALACWNSIVVDLWWI